MSSDGDFAREFESATHHYEQYRARSPAQKKVDSWEVKHTDGGCGDPAALESCKYPLELEESDEEYGCGSALSTHQDPLSPPSSNTGTPLRPVAQYTMTLTPNDTPESERVRPWTPYPLGTNKDQNKLGPGRGRTPSRSPSSKRDASDRSYYSAQEQPSPSPQHRYPGDMSDLSSIADAGVNDRYSSSAADIFYTPSQSPSHTPTRASIQSRNLTHQDEEDEPSLHLSAPRIPQEPFPFSVYDRYNQQNVPKTLNEYDQEWREQGQ
ncbi:hypothetical protein BU16DRAFT_261631 [Lophium mytilinum]|uniref:Uncharacterized protein n=1 Tax=Lophium mytilinum TaxID=390894 RepID=A0A6A6R347_9PEZI|nr:hypothetical protein BU16DRAFT_261631 [Lophium mytilinum]